MGSGSVVPTPPFAVVTVAFFSLPSAFGTPAQISNWTPSLPVVVLRVFSFFWKTSWLLRMLVKVALAAVVYAPFSPPKLKETAAVS